MTPATDWKESIAEGEAAHLERLAEELRDQQRRQARGGKADRALHAKGQLGLEGELTVLPDLPAHARVGPFAAPATFRCYARVSNGAPVRQPDGRPDVRGVALKLLGVQGKKVIPGMENAGTQDFLLIRTPSLPVRDTDEFLALLRAARNPALLPARLLSGLGLRRGWQVLRRVLHALTRPTLSVAVTRYYTAAPNRFGAYAAHFMLDPEAPAELDARKLKGRDEIGEELAERLGKGPVSYRFCAQFFVDEARTPIEDASREWSEAESPWVPLARLVLRQQEPASPRGRKLAQFIEGLSFDPWHAVEELRPLGNIMRGRNAAYRLSTMERGAAAEPDGSERFE